MLRGTQKPVLIACIPDNLYRHPFAVLGNIAIQFVPDLICTVNVEARETVLFPGSVIREHQFSGRRYRFAQIFH